MTIRPRRIAIVTLLASALAVVISFSPAAASAQTSKLWAPAPRPAECQWVSAELLGLDNSGSMRKNHLFTRAVDQLATYVDQAPACSYVILATFGVTSDIRADAWLTDSAERGRLKSVLASLRANDQYTDFDEMARTIDWAQLKLNATYGQEMPPLTVRIMTDGESAPAPGKPAFDLKQFLTERLASSTLNVVEMRLMPTGTLAADTSRPQRYVVLAVPVGVLDSALLRRVVAPAIDSTAVEVAPPGPAASRAAVPPWAIAAAVGALLLLLIAWAFRRRTDLADPAGTESDQGTVATGPEVPAALLVTERDTASDQGGEPRTHRTNERVPVVENAPACFGTDAGRATCVVAPVDGVEASELFTVTPVRGGLIHVRGVAGTKCDGRILPPNGLTVASSSAFLIQIGSRQWSIVPSTDRDGRRPVDQLFSRVQSTGKPTVEPAPIGAAHA